MDVVVSQTRLAAAVRFVDQPGHGRESVRRALGVATPARPDLDAVIGRSLRALVHGDCDGTGDDPTSGRRVQGAVGAGCSGRAIAVKCSMIQGVMTSA
jgi:hypothetical protein